MVAVTSASRGPYSGNNDKQPGDTRTHRKQTARRDNREGTIHAASESQHANAGGGKVCVCDFY